MTHSQTASVKDAFERALGDILARVAVSANTTNPCAFAVAYSGGLDSAALLHLATDYVRAHGHMLFAFHVHHGLSPNADSWLAHCEQQCAALGLRFDARRVALQRRGEGVEQAARISRYAALGELCRMHTIPVLLTAHHQDDQAETVLLQMLRGSGVAGLSGMGRVSPAPALVGDDSLLIGRPLLDVSRDALQRFVTAREIQYVEDESNTDIRYARNALRHQLMPVLCAAFPGFQERIGRTALHAQSAQRLLNELAAQDLATCSDGESVDIPRLRMLSGDRIDNLLRHWFSSRGIRMPATAWLAELREQLLDAKDDARIRVTHPDCEVRRHRGRAFLTARMNDAVLEGAPVPFQWRGETSLCFENFGGCLHFDLTEQGVDSTWLREQRLWIGWRRGGEKLKPALNRSTRSLKHHYQALGVPAWERERLPLVRVESGLLFAAGIGLHWGGFPVRSGTAICLRWEAHQA